MEGICGIITFNGEIPDIGHKIGLMAQKLSDGEPLQISTCVGENWALACGGWREPHWSPLTFAFSDERFAIVGVADVFNLGEFRTLVGGPSDDLGRLMVNGYLQFGSDFFSRIHGNFALLLIDLRKREFIAATDKIGIRPLCWYRRGNVYYVGSRIGVIRELCDSLTIDHNAIYAYVLYSMIPSPQTIYKNVQKLEAGSLIHANPEGVQVKRYWDIENQPKRLESENRIAESVYHSIHEAVTTTRDGCTEAGEVGCFLSGGTDSSSVCGLLRQSFDSPISAYSIGFPARGYDEMHYARIAARAFGLKHHDYYIRPEDVLSNLQPIVAAYDEPFDNSSVFPALLCARLASNEGGHYMFAGDGGDEIFGGNERYGTQKMFEDYFKIPRAIRIWLLESLVVDRLERLPINPLRRAGSYIRRANIPYVERIHSYRYFTDDDIFSADFLASCDTEVVRTIPKRHFSRLPDADLLDRHLYMDMKLTITDNDLRKVTRMCDLGHIRVRYPLLDEKVVQLGFSIPSRLKVKGQKGLRYIFKRAFENLLPQEILQKRKHGFGLPISEWLRTDSRIQKFAYDTLFDAHHLQRGYFRQDFIRDLWELQLNDTTPYYGTVVWQMLMLEMWHRRHYDGESVLK